MEVILQEGNSGKVLKLEPTTATVRAVFPCPTVCDNQISNQTTRMGKNIQLTQFPINIANARTVHKLQGRLLDNVLVSNWSYTSTWIYVVLSRVKTSQGLFVGKPLLYTKTITKENLQY